MNSSDSEELSSGVTLSDENDSDWNPSDEMESDFSESQESSSFSSNGSCASLGYDSPHDDVRVLSSSSSYSTSSGSESSYSSASESNVSSPLPLSPLLLSPARRVCSSTRSRIPSFSPDRFQRSGSLSPGFDAKLLEAIRDIKDVHSDISHPAVDNTFSDSLPPEMEEPDSKQPTNQLIPDPRDDQLKSLEKKIL